MLERRLCLEKRADRRSSDVRPTPSSLLDDEGGRVLACARCEHAVTTSASRIEVEGAHEHTFANPGGYCFHIGCFSRAHGCAAVGPHISYWSWFPPHTWQIEHCTACGEHLGWLFRAEDQAFHGLILDRLRELHQD